MRFDAPTLARAWLSVAQASSSDKDLVTLDRTVAIEEFPTGVRLVATDRYVLLTAWVPDLGAYYEPREPGLDEAPDRTVITKDSDGRGRGLLGYLTQLAHIAQVFAVMALTPQHTFQVLTKRHGRMRSLLNSLSFRIRIDTIEYQMAEGIAADIDGDQLPIDSGRASAAREARRLPDGSIPPRWPLPNVWLGVSVENQQWADIRIPALLDTPAAVRFLSCEPLLGPVDLTQHTHDCHAYFSHTSSPECICGGNLDGLDWVIVGGESGHGARPMHPGWVVSLRNQCVAAGVPFHFKQWGEWQDRSAAPGQRGVDHVIVWDGRHEPARDHWARDERGWWTSELIKARDRNEPGTTRAEFISRVGRKAAGRELDGRTWDEFPEVADV